jgi:hypothetical protein
MTSNEKIETNKINAQLSTGPINTELTKFNAVKHGLLSQELIIPNIEDKKEYEKIALMIRDEIKPMSIIEELLVERLTTSYWRLRRAIKVEKGQIIQNYIEWEHKDIYVGEYSPKEYFQKEKAMKEYNNMPSETILDKILRYETTLERQFYRALKEIEKQKRKEKE